MEVPRQNCQAVRPGSELQTFFICCDLQANFYHCAAYGTPITSNNGGPDPTGCVAGNYDPATLALAVELAGDESNHVLAIQAALGMRLFQSMYACMHVCLSGSQGLQQAALTNNWFCNSPGCTTQICKLRFIPVLPDHMSLSSRLLT